MDWKPIETAPKDGTEIIIGRFAVNVSSIYPNNIQRMDRWHSRKQGDSYEGWGAFNEQFWPPTHWMHLPEPPND